MMIRCAHHQSKSLQSPVSSQTALKTSDKKLLREVAL